ncbi:MAG TPA: hypothetical protein VLD67_19285 [Vicinamibacterales bacterium]|nr:hypothetical protein [Vicinamibacterales bacterium]
MLLLALAVAVQAVPQEPVAYQLTYAAPGDTAITVRLTLPGDPAGPVTLVVPRAVPMGYSQQPYDRYVTDVRATAADGAMLAVEREEGPRWRIGAAEGRVRQVEYRVDLAAMERDIPGATDSSRVRGGYAGLLGYSVFAFVEGWEERPARLSIAGPEDWPLFTTLAPRAPPARGRARADAANFYELADSQVAIGPRLSVLRVEAGVPLYVAAYDEGSADIAFTGRLAAEAIDLLIRYFGSAPFPHYTVHMELLKPISPHHEYGFSMEHLSSSHYFLAAGTGVTPESPPEQRARVRFNFVHHIAHAWIPKRAYGEGYFPFSWELAPLIDTIWLSEGFARYIAIDAVADDLPDPDAAAYRQRMFDSMRTFLAGVPGFIRTMPLVELSRVASTRYSEDFRTGRTLFSRGALLADALDRRIRDGSRGTKRFRDAARYLMDWSTRNRRGIRVDELPGIFRDATGVDTLDIWTSWLRRDSHGYR